MITLQDYIFEKYLLKNKDKYKITFDDIVNLSTYINHNYIYMYLSKYNKDDLLNILDYVRKLELCKNEHIERHIL